MTPDHRWRKLAEFADNWEATHRQAMCSLQTDSLGYAYRCGASNMIVELKAELVRLSRPARRTKGKKR